MSSLLESWGEPSYRARQIWTGLYQRLAADFQSLTDLPKVLRERLGRSLRFSALSSAARVSSADGSTEKVLFTLPDGEAIETVLMRYEQRVTVCISTQSGCGMGCPFCATGQMGFRRHLTAGEILEQVLFFARELSAEGSRLSNVVVMGMGEPFHNYDATMAALNRLNDPEGFQFGARRFTISTVGLIPAIERFTLERSQVNLAVSLHAATNKLRDEILPINQRYPLEQLIPACKDYTEQTGRRLTFEWALMQEVNDDPAQATALVGTVSGWNCHVNLIPLNPTNGFAGQPSTTARVQQFRDRLLGAGVSCSVRLRRGIEIQAGCGQLATKPRPGSA